MNKLTSHQIEALDIQRHISLTANAGSGKTFVFAKRYVEIAVNASVSLRNIVAITFTDKAAGELNSRIGEEIEKRLSEETDSRLIKKLNEIRRYLVSANISTIHSFCIDLLKAYAPELNIDASFIPIDQRLANELLELSIDDSIKTFQHEEPYVDEYKKLVRHFGSKKMLKQQLTYLIQKRKTVNNIKEQLYSKSDEELLSYFNELFENEFTQIFSDRYGSFIRSVKRINDEVLAYKPDNATALEIQEKLGEFDTGLSSDKISVLLSEIFGLILTGKGTVKLKGYLSVSDDDLPEDRSNVEEFYEDYRKIQYNGDPVESTKELIDISRKFLNLVEGVEDRYAQKKESRGYLDFEDILLFALKLTSQEEVTEQLGEKYKYIMIDEYQDTNDIQYNIFMPVLNNLSRGNLFVVGDEKQSIYMFRDADIGIYQKTRDELEATESNGKLVSLPHSFRMHKGIAAFSNNLFQKLFNNPISLFGEVSYSELICGKESDDPGTVEFIVADKETIPEKELVARRILELYNEDGSEEFSFGDIAILCRKRTNFSELEEEFSKYNIPYVVVGGKGFYQQQVILDVYNYLSFMVDSNNDLALIGILRSPFFLMSDANIYEVSFSRGDTYFEKLKNYISENTYFSKSLQLLEKHISIAASYDISQLIKIILKDTGYWRLIRLNEDSSQQIKNLEKLISIAAGFTNQSFVTLYDFLEHLKNSSSNIEDEGQAGVDDNQNAVKLMTIHQSKGLEFETVILYKSHEYGKDSSVKAKQLDVDKKYGLVAKVFLDNNYFDDQVTPPVVALYNYISSKKQEAELKRLLYVAVTRAVKRLVISGVYTGNKLRKDSFLGLIEHGLSIDLTKESLLISDTIKVMRKDEDTVKDVEERIELPVRIIKEINADGLEGPNVEHDEKKRNKRIQIEEIPDTISEEFISATKIAVFTQCPVKYQLTYDLGFSKLTELVRNNTIRYDFKFREDDETQGMGDLRGRIIHALLDREVPEEKVGDEVRNLLGSEIANKHFSLDQEKFVDAIENMMVNYYKSKTYAKYKASPECFNEYEIYAAEEDFYLYGIVDKLIMGNDRLIIVDYKTDNVTSEKVDKKGTEYLTQLMFYANILSKKYTGIKEFELRIIFIQQPDVEFFKVVSIEAINEFNKKLKSIVTDMRTGNYSQNKEHCVMCHFSLGKNKCIKD